MNRDATEGRWTAAMERIRARWDEFAGNELEHVDNEWEALCGRVQRNYGLTREEAERILRNV